MRDLAGSCANIHARRCRPLRDPTRTHGCQRFSTGVGTDPTSKAIGCPDLGNDHLIVMTNLRARQALYDLVIERKEGLWVWSLALLPPCAKSQRR